jgi:hypothetical protein
MTLKSLINEIKQTWTFFVRYSLLPWHSVNNCNDKLKKGIHNKMTLDEKPIA